MATATRDAIAQRVIEALASFGPAGDDAASVVTVADTIDLVIGRLP